MRRSCAAIGVGSWVRVGGGHREMLQRRFEQAGRSASVTWANVPARLTIGSDASLSLSRAWPAAALRMYGTSLSHGSLPPV